MRRVGWGPGKGRRIGLVLNCPGRAEAGWGRSSLRSLAASVYPVCSSGLSRDRRASLGPGSARSPAAIGGAEQRRRGRVRVSESAGRLRAREGAAPPGRGRGLRELRAAGRPGGRPGVRQRREPRSFPLTRRAELRAGPGLSQSLPPLRPDAQTWLGCTDGRPAERTAGRCARCDPGSGTRVAAASLASVGSAGKCRGP